MNLLPDDGKDESAMHYESATLQLQFVTRRRSSTKGLWVGAAETPDGIVELTLDGTPDGPNPAEVTAMDAFLPTAGATIARLRRKLTFGFLYHPIRFGVNTQNRVVVQFRNRITGSQAKVLFADEG